MINKKKGKTLKGIWIESEKQFNDLKNALNEGRNDDVLDIIYDIYLGGGLE